VRSYLKAFMFFSLIFAASYLARAVILGISAYSESLLCCCSPFSIG